MKHKAFFTKNTDKPKPETSHHCILVHDGEAYRGTDQIGKLCRKLQTGTLEIYRGDMLCLTVDVEKRKGTTLSENKVTGFRSSRYVEFDATVFDK